MTVTKEFTFDMAHRLPNHEGKCKNIHGHTYKLQVTVEGSIKGVRSVGDSDEGMVIDFKQFKEIVNKFINDHLDHYYLSYSGDHAVNKFMREQKFLLTVVDFIPTAENMVNWIEKELGQRFFRIGLSVFQIKLWETPTSFATLYNN